MALVTNSTSGLIFLQIAVKSERKCALVTCASDNFTAVTKSMITIKPDQRRLILCAGMTHSPSDGQHNPAQLRWN